jgi:hypothetical protein
MPTEVRHRRSGRLLAVIGLALLVSVAACNRQSSIGQARGEAGPGSPADTLGSKELLQKGGLCAENRLVDKPEPGTHEWLIYRVYELALGADTPENLAQFYDLFPRARNRRELKEMYWPRIRKNVHKFLAEPGKPAYRICRSIAVDEGRKYYIVTSDPRQHPPPVIAGPADGAEKIIMFTPF